jgi:hypothetical protein
VTEQYDLDALREEIQRVSVDGKASCKALLAAASAVGAPPAEVARLCDEMGVRVRACQLGCFR